MNNRDQRFKHNTILFKHVTDFLGDMPDDAGVSHENSGFLFTHRQHHRQVASAVRVFALTGERR